MMRDAQRIEHMLNFVRRSLEILDGVDRAEFIAAIGLQEQVEVNMIHLGEPAARMSDELKEKHPDIPWQEMVGMRNVLTHEYFRVKPTILFETVTSQFKLLEHQLEELQIEYP